MNNESTSLQLATSQAAADTLGALRAVDAQGMLGAAFETPHQILAASLKAKEFHEGDIPLDRSRFHLVGLGGSAIAGELLRDMVSPRRGISVHRGTRPPRDKAGVIVSSYSGNTREIIELSYEVTGGLRSVVFMTSGGMLERLAFESAIPLWRMPTGYQPRAAVGWSLALVAAILERWHVAQNVEEKIVAAARRLEEDISQGEPQHHPLVRASLPLAEALLGKTGVIFHSLRCTGAARRLAAQINENAKQPAFPLVMPEAMHNGVEGLIGAGDPSRWTLLFMSDVNDLPSLREAMQRTMRFFAERGFVCLPFPSAGNDSFELTLSRVFIADMVSLFLAALRGVDPTPIPTISEVKKLEPALDLYPLQMDRVEFH